MPCLSASLHWAQVDLSLSPPEIFTRRMVSGGPTRLGHSALGPMNFVMCQTLKVIGLRTKFMRHCVSAIPTSSHPLFPAFPILWAMISPWPLFSHLTLVCPILLPLLGLSNSLIPNENSWSHHLSVQVWLNCVGQ